jgi:hypothetical protein
MEVPGESPELHDSPIARADKYIVPSTVVTTFIALVLAGIYLWVYLTSTDGDCDNAQSIRIILLILIAFTGLGIAVILFIMILAKVATTSMGYSSLYYPFHWLQDENEGVPRNFTCRVNCCKHRSHCASASTWLCKFALVFLPTPSRMAHTCMQSLWLLVIFLLLPGVARLCVAVAASA